MLSGEYRHNIDNKGRIIVPSKIREEMGGRIVITRGLDGCLFGYSEKTWESIMEKLNSLPFTKRDARNFTRFMTSGAITLEFDKQGRINFLGNQCQNDSNNGGQQRPNGLIEAADFSSFFAGGEHGDGQCAAQQHDRQDRQSPSSQVSHVFLSYHLKK